MNKNVNISFDPDEIDRYLDFHGSIQVVNSDYAKHVFLCATKDFLQKIIDSDMLSGIANRVFYLDKYKFFLDFDPDLDLLLDHISELKYLLTIKETDTVNTYLDELNEYYSQNKDELAQEYYRKYDHFPKVTKNREQ